MMKRKEAWKEVSSFKHSIKFKYYYFYCKEVEIELTEDDKKAVDRVFYL